MDDEFDTSVDTSSFDDTSSDFSDTSDFDTSTDVGEIMDDSSFEVADTFDESDFSSYEASDVSSDVSDLMDDTSDEYIETLDTSDLSSDIAEDESGSIESLMDDTATDEFAEVSDAPSETDLAVESDIVDLMDEAALESTEEDLEVFDGESSDTSDVSELMGEEVTDETIEGLEDVDNTDGVTDETTEDIESLMDLSGEEITDTTEETADIATEVAEDSSDVSDLMSETDEVVEEQADVTDESLGETVEESDVSDDTLDDTTDNFSDETISDVIDGDVSDETVETIEEVADDTAMDVSDSEVTDDSGEIMEDVSETDGSAYDRLSEYYSSHNYGQGDYAEYSQDPEWQELNNAYLQEIGQEPIEYGSDTDASAYDNLMAYMSSHNYGQQDAAEYSQDPEWQELNNAYRIEQGMEPIDYGENDWTDTHVEDFKDELVALGIPEDSPELDAIIENEQQGIDEINSNTPIDEAESEDLLNGVEETIDETPAETIEGIDSFADTEMQETVEDIAETPRVFDDFENSVLEGKPDFYDTGSFYEQGINEFGYQGTCGPTSQANALNKLFDTNEFTENKVLNVAVDNNLCSMDSAPENCGGTTTEQFMELYDKMNEQMDGKIDTQLYEYNNALDVNDVASKLDEGCVLNVAVDANALWDQPREYVNSMGIPCDDFYSDHWITVTGVQRDELGNVQGFDIIDSGGGVDYVSADKYHEMCFGTDDHRVIDPTAIVVSKKDVSPTGDITATEDTSSDINDSTSNNSESGWFQRIFGRRNN